MNFITQIAKELSLHEKHVSNVVELLDNDNTIPFIARYRKEATGEMDENVLRALDERLKYLRNLEARKEEVIRLIDEQGKLTEELVEAIKMTTILQEVEDLYRPYKQKRKTRASVAKEKGLEPLALIIFAQGTYQGEILALAGQYVSEELGVEKPEDALQGALDIIAEMVADDAEIRKIIREITFREGIIETKRTAKEKVTPYEMYYDYQEPVRNIPPHRILAINRGENEEALSVKIATTEEKIVEKIKNKVITNNNSPFVPNIIEAIVDAYKRLIAPSIEREVRNELTAKGEEQAIKVFSANLRNLLLQPPVRGKVVLGVDPGFRTGCKLSVVDETGKVLAIGVMYPHPPQNKRDEAKKIIADFTLQYNVEIIAIGNGTASRESEQLVAEVIKEKNLKAAYIIVSEAGASVYSASKIAGEEFPQYDLSLRSAVSIARRLQDPLAELVKIEPKAVGVGQYQHDVTPKKLDESLTVVVESAVNSVGVDLNTASASLLQYVAGIKPAVAKSIVKFREEKGKFKKRTELKKVPRLGEQTFIQCAGFIRLPDGEDPIENTPVHPESYNFAEAILIKIDSTKEDLINKHNEVREKLIQLNVEETAKELGAGIPTLRDIIDALLKPGRDPRDELPKPILLTEVTSIENIKEGMILQGTVRNVVDFGAFVDIGIKNDGLVHISQIADKFIKHPMEVVAVGDIVKVKVISVDMERHKVGLSIKEAN